MINLRYHIVSLTAVFLAIGIGLAFGSSFLDQATVNSLERQLDGLQAGLAERDERISDLNSEVADLAARQDSLDDEGTALLSGRAEGVPVIIIANDGADVDAVTDLVAALTTADADVAGVWRLTDRFLLDDDGEVADLTEVTGVTSGTPTMLRRSSVSALAAVIEGQQAVMPVVESDDAESDQPDGDDESFDPTRSTSTTIADDVGPEDTDPDSTHGPFGDAGDAVDDQALVDGLFDRGFLEYTAVADGPDRPFVPAGARVVLVGGAEALPDGWILVPLAEELQDGPAGNSLIVATSASPEAGDTASLVTTVRDATDLRDQVSSVEDITHFSGRAAVVLVVADLGTGPVGHYGMSEGSTRLLPAPPDS